MKRLTKLLALSMCCIGFVLAQTSLFTIYGTDNTATSAHLTVTAAGDDKAYLCPDEFNVLGEATLTTWNPDATCGAIPGAPMNLDAVGMDEHVMLSWDANTEPDIVNYHIARGTESDRFGYHIAGVDKNATEYKDENVVNGVKYYYEIWAVDNAGNASGRSNTADATPQDVDAPSTPGNFVAEAGDGIVTLTWDNCPEPDVVNYHISRATEPGGFGNHIGGVDGGTTEFVDSDVINGNTYYYQIWAADEAGNASDRTENVEATPSVSLDTEDIQELPETFSLEPNYPNPFNPTTTIKYNLPEAVRIQIIIFDMLGHKVRTLINGYIEPGYHSVLWDATDDLGKPVSGGIYIYSIKSDKFNSNRKMILLK